MVATNSVGIDVNVASQSVVFITNTIMHAMQRIAHKRGLDPGYIQRNFQVIENGVRTWMTEGKLKSIMIQVYIPGTGQALENWKTVLDYQADPDVDLRKPPIQQIEEFCTGLRKLPPSAKYQIFANVDNDASHVEGWTPGRPMPIFGKTRKDFVKWGHGGLDAGLEYEGADFDSLLDLIRSK